MSARLLESITQNHDFMKIYILTILAAILAISHSFGKPEPEDAVSLFADSQIKKFESLPDREAFDLWLDSHDPVAASTIMMESALRNGRMGFLELLFKNSDEYNYLIDAVAKMPNSINKDKIVIMMLRWQSPFWQDENTEPIYNGSRPAAHTNAIEPFVGTIGKYLPSMSIEEKSFSTKLKRFKIAADLDAAMGNASSTPQVERPIKRKIQQQTPQSSSAKDSKDTELTHAAQDTKVPKTQTVWTHRLTWGVSLMVFVGLLWMLFNKLKNK